MVGNSTRFQIVWANKRKKERKKKKVKKERKKERKKLGKMHKQYKIYLKRVSVDSYILNTNNYALNKNRWIIEFTLQNICT